LELLLFDDLRLLVCVYYFRVNDGNTLGSTPIDRLGYVVLLLISLCINIYLTYSAWDIEEQIKEDSLVLLSLEHGNASVLGEDFELRVDRLSPVFVRMKVGTVVLQTHILLSASMHLIVEWVVLLLLPSMRVLAPVLMFAPICIG
jgi:hypothetical protein